MATFTGEIITTTFTLESAQNGYGQYRLIALPGSNTNPIPYYKLSCEDNTGLRHYWVDSGISLTNAPDGFTYVSNTFVIEGKF